MGDTYGVRSRAVVVAPIQARHGGSLVDCETCHPIVWRLCLQGSTVSAVRKWCGCGGIIDLRVQSRARIGDPGSEPCLDYDGDAHGLGTTLLTTPSLVLAMSSTGVMVGVLLFGVSSLRLLAQRTVGAAVTYARIFDATLALADCCRDARRLHHLESVLHSVVHYSRAWFTSHSSVCASRIVRYPHTACYRGVWIQPQSFCRSPPLLVLDVWVRRRLSGAVEIRRTSGSLP